MAAIDKTYVNKAQLAEAVKWCKYIGETTLENGHKFSPIHWIESYNDINDKELWEGERESFILWNTPTWFDRWLWVNCPLGFVRERLRGQYTKDYLKKFEEWNYEKPEQRKCKYKFIETPSGEAYKWWMNNARKYNRWPGNCKQATYEFDIQCPNEKRERRYDEQTNQWYEMFGMLPCGIDYVWQEYHKRIPSKKAIIRQLDKWNLPKGTIVKLRCIRYRDLDFKIVVK